MDKLSLLLVEDNADDEWFSLRALKMMGIKNVAVARDGCEAVAMLRAAALSGHRFLPDLILLDLELPKLNGLEVLHMLRSEEATARLNVAVVSSNEDPDVLGICHRLGALACLPKPLSAELLLPIILPLPQPSTYRPGTWGTPPSPREWTAANVSYTVRTRQW